MRFASLGGQSNYAQAGKAVADDAARTFKAARDNSPNFGELAQRAMVEKSKQNIAADNNATSLKINDNKLDQKAIVSKSRRKAGVVAAMGKAGLGMADMFMGKEKKADYSSYDAKIKTERDKATALRTQADGINTEFKPAPANTGGTGASNASTTASSGGNSSVSAIPNGAYSGSLDSLSDDDKKWISYTVSSEAAMNTDDEFGVAGVVINRMKSGNYPTSAYDVGHQKGQFEGVEIGNSVHDQKLYDRLFSAGGLQKLEGAMTTLDGRDSFKGQALLHNRSSKGNKEGKLDPMFHSSGNYFHHSYQT